MSSLNGILRTTELKNRILFTLMLLAVYRVGVMIPTPGIDRSAVMSFFQSQSSGIFGLFNTFSGGALSQFSIFALGIMPYISSSIIFQLLSTAIPYLDALRKEGEQGRKKINQYTRYATVVLALIQGTAISNWLLNSSSPDGKPLVVSMSVGILSFQIMTVLTLTAGTCFIMWLGEQITERGIGNGTSLIIFSGISASIPGGAQKLFSLVDSDELSVVYAFLVLAVMVAVVYAVIYIEVAQRKIPIQYSQKVAAGKGGLQSPMSHLPIKVNFSGVIPPIFASSLLMFPATVTQFVKAPWLQSIQEALNPNGSIYNILFVSLIVFFCFFYTEIVFNAKEVAENLKKFAGFVPGVRSGQSTAEFIQTVIDRVNVGGAIYLSVICVLPGILNNFLKVPFYFGGTSLLILVGVALDTTQQIQSYLFNHKYDGLIKGAKIKSRRVQY